MVTWLFEEMLLSYLKEDYMLFSYLATWLLHKLNKNDLSLEETLIHYLKKGYLFLGNLVTQDT